MSSNTDKLRIPQVVIDKLVTDTEIVELIGRYLKLKKQGSDYLALCPFHKEATPSFTVSPGKQFYYCFGCGAGGNSMSFQQEYLGRSFIAVIQEMATDNGVDLTPYLRMAQGSNLEFKLQPALEKASLYFQQAMAAASDASVVKKYLQERNISQAASERFSLGLAGYNNDIVAALSDITEEMTLGGILDSGDRGIFSLFRNRLMMPIRDMRGKTIGLSGRTLEEDVKPKYKNSKESQLFSRNSVLYGLYEACQTEGKDVLDHVDVVEGQTDVISEWMIGRPACAAMGSSLSPQQLRLLIRHAKAVTFMFDGDAAGIKAMIQVCSLLLEQLSNTDTLFQVTLLPDGEDPNSLINRDIGEFNKAISDPIPWLDALFKYLPEAKDLETDRGRAEYARRCIELIHDARDPLLRHQATEKAAKACGFPIEVMTEKLLSLPVSRSGQAMKGTATEIAEDTAVRLTRMLWDEPSLLANIKHPALWAEEGDSLLALLAGWVEEAQRGEFDGQYSDSEAKALLDSPEKMEQIDAKSRWRVAGSSLGRRLSSAQIPGLMELLMKDEPEAGSGLAVSYIWHITGLCAAKGMQAISQKAQMSLMDDQDRARFTQLMAIRRDASNRLKE